MRCRLLLALIAWPALASAQPAIHCKHFFYGYPTGMPDSNPLVVRDIYALSSNNETKLADWVAYRLDQATIEGDVSQSRNWHADPWLSPDQTLEPSDYDNANSELGTDRGHQAPLASFKGTDTWSETNYLSNITAQDADLNEGAWKNLEDAVRTFVGTGQVAYVVTGPYYEGAAVSLPAADEPNRIPSGYWKIIAIQTDAADPSTIETAAFMFAQDTARDFDHLEALTTIDAIEAKSGLDFLRLLPDEVEASLEADDNGDWARGNF